MNAFLRAFSLNEILNLPKSSGKDAALSRNEANTPSPGAEPEGPGDARAPAAHRSPEKFRCYDVGATRKISCPICVIIFGQVEVNPISLIVCVSGARPWTRHGVSLVELAFRMDLRPSKPNVSRTRYVAPTAVFVDAMCNVTRRTPGPGLAPQPRLRSTRETRAVCAGWPGTCTGAAVAGSCDCRAVLAACDSAEGQRISNELWPQCSNEGLDIFFTSEAAGHQSCNPPYGITTDS